MDTEKSYDIFISYTTRGATDNGWVTSFREHLQRAYISNYRKTLEIWDMTQNGPGVNFEDAIDQVLQQTRLLIVVLDPKYIDSPQTLVEIKKFTDFKAAAGEDPIIIKVIRQRGDADFELRKLIDSHILVSYFSAIGPDKIERELKDDSPEYEVEIERIVQEIRKYKTEHDNKRNADCLLARLAEIKPFEKIFVAFGDRGLEDSRVKLINQLTDSLKRSTGNKMQQIRVLPDDFTLAVEDMTYADLGQLICVENPFLDKVLDEILDACSMVIIPFETDSIGEAEQLLERISWQLDAIKRKVVKKDIRVYMLLNIPEILFETPIFKQQLLNPAYASYNIRIIKKQDIATFINNLVTDLQNLVDPAPPPPPPDEKYIYLIEYNNATQPVTPSDLIVKEKQNRDEMKKVIRDELFDVVTNFDIEDDISLDEAIRLHKEWLSMSLGVIIYRGIREEDTWCPHQQGATFKALRQLNKDKVKRAVFVDSLQANKERAVYSIFKYDVLLDNPPELKNFLCTIQNP